MKLVATLLLQIIILSGCVFAPTIDSFRRAGITKADRASLLGGEVKKFHDALYWGQAETVLSMISEQAREDVLMELKGRTDEERIVESKIVALAISDDGFEANVEVAVRYFKVPTYIVNKRKEKELWRFSMTDGWRLVEREVQN